MNTALASSTVLASSIPFRVDEIIYLQSKIDKNKVVYIEDVLDALASQEDEQKAAEETQAVIELEMLLNEDGKTHFRMDL